MTKTEIVTALFKAANNYSEALSTPLTIPLELLQDPEVASFLAALPGGLGVELGDEESVRRVASSWHEAAQACEQYLSLGAETSSALSEVAAAIVRAVEAHEAVKSLMLPEPEI